MVQLHFDDGLTTAAAANESPMKRKQHEGHHQKSPDALPAGPENIFAYNKHKKRSKRDQTELTNGIHNAQGSGGHGFQDNALMQNSVSIGSKGLPGSGLVANKPTSQGSTQTQASPIANGSSTKPSGDPKKKRDHAEFSSDSKDPTHSPNTPDPANPIGRRKMKELMWKAKMEERERERTKLALPPLQVGAGTDNTPDGIGKSKKHKVDAATETASETANGVVKDSEVEFLQGKKKRKREKLREQKEQEWRDTKRDLGVKPTLINGVQGTSVDRRKFNGVQGKPLLTNGTTHKTDAPRKNRSNYGEGVDTDVDTEPDGSPPPMGEAEPAPTLPSPPPPPPRQPETKTRAHQPEAKPPQALAKPSQTKTQHQPQQHQLQQKGKHNRGPEALLRHRRQLPIWPYQDALRRALRERDILVMLGETGSGKSTQLVQFLLNEPWMQPDASKNEHSKRHPPCIAITQPRRIAATSLAYRVAEELGVTVGNEVGYSVRFDNKSDPYKTRIKFLTDGMLLREMLEDPQLNRYRAVIVDEAHERTVSGDLVLGFLKGLVKTGGARSRGVVQGQKGKGKPGQHNLKVVIMSATVEVEKLAEFFEETPDASFEVGVSQSTVSKGSSSSRPESNVGICFVSGRQYRVETFYTPTPIDDYVHAALRTVYQIHFAEPLPGDILVFLPGQDDIDSLERMIVEYSQFLDRKTVPDILPLPLYAGLPQQLQQRIFQRAPTPRTRKVIIATNIAETSITVPGVRFVVDSGKQKSRQYRPRIGLDSLLVTAVSKSSAEQRKGRAGREAPGKCYRLYTEETFKSLQDNSIPEILRVDVASSILILKARGQNDVVGFDYLDSPTRESLMNALQTLLSLGALDGTGAITSLGLTMAKLPLEPLLSRVLIAALEPSTIDILPEVIDIIAAISTDGILQPISLTASDERREEIETARRPLYRREGDHLFFLSILRGYLRETHDNRRAWAQKRAISYRAMMGAVDIRKQLRQYCTTLAPPEYRKQLYPRDDEVDEHIAPDKAERVLRCFLKGYFANTARLVPDGTYRTVMNTTQTVAVHPQSILFSGFSGNTMGGRETGGGELKEQRRKFEAIMYHEWVFTTKPYARCVSAVQLDWVMDANPGYLVKGRGGG